MMATDNGSNPRANRFAKSQTGRSLSAMQTNLYVALSAQIALQKRIDTIANNVANAATAGYRAEEVKFESRLQQLGADSVAFAAAGNTYLSRRAGEMVQTGNPLDVAIRGDN